MIARFLAIVRPAGAQTDGWVQSLTARALRDFDLRPVFDHERVIVLANSAMPATRIDGAGGVVLGTVFRRGEGARRRSDAALLAKTIASSAGEDLIQSWWGGYVAIIANKARGPVHILRDPSGATPCYRKMSEGAHILYSDVAVPHALGLVEAKLDPAFAAHYVAYPDLRGARTGLVGVDEVLAGTRLSLRPGGEAVTECCWTPWTFAAADRQISDRAQAVAEVRAETQRCVAAWASQSRSILLELSGGLDSSIVAACLKDQAASVSCVTAVTPDPGADERRYAAIVADSIGARLEAILLQVEAGDVLRPPKILSPRPGTGVLQQVLDSGIADQARAVGADAFFTGGGGDNVFCYLNTAAPAADVLRTRGVGPLFGRTVGDLAVLHQCTTWRAGALAIRKAWRRPRPWRHDKLFIAADADPATPGPHPWLDAPSGALPGKREHVAALMRIQNAPDGKERHALAPVRYPLLSQPLVELCLTIPSWMWISAGRNRAVARDAFADRLPAAILERRTKGDFTGFCGAVYERQRTALADLLLGGWLAGQGILDPVAVEAYLAAPVPPKDIGFYRLLELAGVEVWARSWLALEPLSERR